VTGPQTGSLFRLTSRPPLAEVACMAVARNDMKLWHERLGHISQDRIMLMKANGTKGMEHMHYISDFACDACTHGKRKRTAIKDTIASCATEPGERAYSDLCGPFPVPSAGGAHVVYTHLDCYTWYATVDFIATKDKAIQDFKNYDAWLETQHNMRLKRIHTDNGGEFDSKVFNDYCKS
jgi:hypothetical protein